MSNYNLDFKLPNLEEFVELNPLTVSPETQVIDAIANMNQPRQSSLSNDSSEKLTVNRSSYLLVLEKSKLVGVLTERDIVKISAASIDLKSLTVGEVMSTNVITLQQSDFIDIYQVMSILKQSKIRHLPVVDDWGQLEGIISSESICRTLNPSNLLKMRSVEEVMNAQVLQASPTSSILTLSQLMVEQNQRCVVIIDRQSSNLGCELPEQDIYSETPIGIVTERDIVQFQILGLDLPNTIAQTVMSTPLICMKPTDSLLLAQEKMKKLRVRRLVVAGESGKLRGIISFQDMLRVFNTAELYGVISTLKQELNQQAKHLQKEIEQRHKSEQELQENQKVLELFVSRAPAAIAMVDREMRYLVASDRWIRDYQLENKNVIGRTHYELFPELPERWKQDHQDIITGKVKVLESKEDSFIRPDGRVDWLRWELRPWHNLSGQIGGLLMLSEVITEGKLLEQKLQSSEAQMRAMFEALTDLVLTIELSSNSIQVLPTRFSDLNNSLVHTQIIEQIHLLIFDSTQSENYQSLIQKILQTQKTINFEHSFKLKDATYWFSTNISPVSDTIVIWVGHNITHRKEMEQILYAEKELAQVTLKCIGDGVITTNASGQVKFVNLVAEQLTGWSTAEARGKPLQEIFQIVHQITKEPVINPVDLVLKENRIYELANDTVLISRDGKEYGIKDSAAPIQNRQGNLIGAVIVFHDVTHARRLTNELSWQATHDPLTKLYNRHKFEQQVNIAIQDAQENETSHALCYLDLDRFKIVNDSCGHAAGDELLKQVTKLLKQRIRTSDIFARLGGDEFGLLLHQCPIDIAQKIANQLRQLVEDFRFVWEDKIFRIGVSVGLVAINHTAENLTSILNKADTACYAAKEKGRNCVYLYHEEDVIVAQQRGQRQWVEKINLALEENKFCLYAQKIISIEKKVTGSHYEILLRLIDESGTIIAPGAFLPAAERYDLMPAIDRWVITTFLAGYEAYCQVRQEKKLSPPTNLYTINLSGASINSQDFSTFLQKQFEIYAVPAQTICFEITETVAISNINNAVNLIKKLKKFGCSIALDDFGSGMCSLNYLKNLPVDYLKIDGSFVKNIASNRIDYATVECFNHISQIMGIKTIAEFVENDDIVQNLKQIGVDYAQGYEIERPKPLKFGVH